MHYADTWMTIFNIYLFIYQCNLRNIYDHQLFNVCIISSLIPIFPSLNILWSISFIDPSMGIKPILDMISLCISIPGATLRHVKAGNCNDAVIFYNIKRGCYINNLGKHLAIQPSIFLSFINSITSSFSPHSIIIIT
jgi:hypothetical protein